MALHQPNDIIAHRYRIVAPLGEGGMGITYEAEDLTNYQRVAVKAVSLRQAQDWKLLELFEREAKVLAHLHHPGIPKYLDYFYSDTNKDRQFYLIRELVSGQSLAAWVEKGWHPTEGQIQYIATQILEIISYLHQLNPPIIHRDIKPQNIILQPDGEVFLVDFGAVQDIYRNTIYLSGTFVGTIGYMPPEQLRGKAYCASDLYSLGGTLLYLLTHRSPDELPQQRMKVDFRSRVSISPQFADWLEVMLEPIYEDRFQSATEALNALQNNSAMTASTSSGLQSTRYEKPVGSRVKIKRTPKSLIVDIPPIGLKESELFWTFFGLTLISVWAGFSLPLIPVCASFSILSILFLLHHCTRTRIEINIDEFFIHWKCLIFSEKIRGKTANLDKISINKIGRRWTSSREENVEHPIKINCTLLEGNKKYKFGSLLTPQEKEWLVAEMSDFLQQLKFR